MPRKTAHSGVLRGLDEGSIIKNQDETEIHHTTRQSIHGRQDALYDVKYHPMDDIVRPASAARHYRNVVNGTESGEDEHGMSKLGSESENYDHGGGSRFKRQRLNGKRRSKRRSSQKVINYSTKFHPQDNLLRAIDSRIVKYAPEMRKPVQKRAVTTEVEDSEAEESSEDETEVSRAVPTTITDFSPGIAISSSSHCISSDSILNELFPPQAPQTQSPAVNLPRSSLVAYSSSEGSDEEAELNPQPSPKTPIVKYSSDVLFSSQFSAGQSRRAKLQEITVYQDSEGEKDIPLVSRAVTEFIARESDYPKENEVVGIGITETNDAVAEGEAEFPAGESQSTQESPDLTSSDRAVEEAFYELDVFGTAYVGPEEGLDGPAVAEITLTSSIPQSQKPRSPQIQ